MISSHSSAIGLDRAVSQKLSDEDQIRSVSVQLKDEDNKSRESLGKIPTPIKPTSRPVGLSKKPTQVGVVKSKLSEDSGKDSKSDVGSGSSSNNTWISTQKPQKKGLGSGSQKKVLGSGSQKHPILLNGTVNKKQKTLSYFVKKNEGGGKQETKSKYF